jgi:type I restriction enzyme R subunit
MNSVGQRERMTQNVISYSPNISVITILVTGINEKTTNIEPGLVSAWLTKRGVSET